MEQRVLLYYRYCKIEDPKTLMERERAVCEVLGLKGRIIIAHEGMNGTVEGTFDATEKFIEHLRRDKRFRLMDIKTSPGNGQSFPKLSVKVKPEIVATKFPEHINPNKATGKYLPAHELKRMYENNDDFVVIDMRNDYEIESGYFEKTVNPGLVASRDLPIAMDKLKVYKDKKVVTVCTGGVRCEKMSAYLLDQGFKDVYQLHNGMHTFMEKYPGEHFKGTLYTFDNRKVMDFGGEREVVGECIVCNNRTERYQDCRCGCKTESLVCDGCKEVSNICEYKSRRGLKATV